MLKKLLVAGVTLALVAVVFSVAGVAVTNAQSVTCANIGSMLTVLGITDAAKVAQANAALGCGAASVASFTRNLTVGSTGADVTALQTKLGVTPATGYFGAITKAAVMAYQTANGLPSTGYVGPLTLAKLNAGGAVAGTPAAGCPAGMTCTPAVAATCPAGYTCTSNATGATVGTTGVEGTLSVDQGAVSNTTVYEGQTAVQVLNLRLRASASDINVARVQVDLGTSANIYAKAFSTLSVVGDNGQVLASVPLNQSTVTKTGSRYSVTITGFNYLVAKNQYRYLSIAADVYGSVNDSYKVSPYTFTLPDQGVRGTDGAGLDEYTSGTFSQAITISTSLSDAADLKLSTNSATPLTGAVIANGGSLNDEADKVTVLVFNLKAEKDSIGVTDIVASTTVNSVGNNASTTSAYLYDGSTLVASAAVQASGTVAFNNISGVEGYVIPKDTTKAFTLKVDLRKQGVTPGTLLATVLSNGISAVNSQGVNITNRTGTASSNALYAQKAGPVFTLVGTPTLTKTTNPGNSATTSKFLATFVVDVAAQGVDVTVASTSAFTVGIYTNTGSQLGTDIAAGYEKPTTVTQSPADTGPYLLTDGSSAARFTIQTSFDAPSATYASGIISARIKTITTDAGTVGYISDTFRTGSQTI